MCEYPRVVQRIMHPYKLLRKAWGDRDTLHFAKTQAGYNVDLQFPSFQA